MDRKRSGHYKGDPLTLGDDSPLIMTVSGSRLNPTTLSKWWVDERGSHGLEGSPFMSCAIRFSPCSRSTACTPR